MALQRKSTSILPSTSAYIATALGLLLLAALVMLGCSLVGYYKLSFGPGWQVWSWPLWQEPVWKMRLVRLLTAALVGSGLATTGMALQGLLRNPLAEPYVLGVSSGAGIGVLLGASFASMGFLPDWMSTPMLAFAGALATCAVVYLIAQRQGQLDPFVLLLAGVIVNIFNGAIILAILQLVQETMMIHFIGWGMGQIPEWLWFKPKLLWLCGSLLVSGCFLVFLRGSALNTLGLGDEVATSSGVNVPHLRLQLFLIISLITSAAVALAGPVGFVGLIIPHVCRMIFGPDHRRLTIVCFFIGGMFLMLADTFCRLLGEWLKMGEIPVGVITALLGGPFFIILLKRRHRGGRL